ncbi:MAG: tetratricopeptide repeat protein [Syntrophales bacterium]|nr:tetratricopeptide repeat protein [Syntrophales bacterium]MDX9922125.1 tetratricopeptide repeat protein [Syntrophales bacterium]
MSMGDPSEYNTLYDYADSCAGDGRHEEALKIYEKLLAANPGDDSLLLSIAWVHKDSGDTEKALHCLQQVLEKELARKVFTGFAYDELVRMYREMGEYDRLVLLCERAATIYPDDTALLDTLGSACLKSGRAERALAIFSRLVEMDPEAPVYHMNRACAAVAAGQYDEAESSCAAAFALEPEDGRLFYGRLAMSYKDTEQYGRAEKAQNRALELCPGNPLYHCGLGEIMLKQGKIDEARGAFEDACRADPASRAGFHNRLANMMLREGYVTEAADEFEKAIAADPGNPFYYITLIACCDRLGEHERADRYRDRGRREGVLPDEG